MAVIHVLDKHTAELIAAGEVVERPSSVIKELTENAIDAGATQITVSIERGGVSMMQIADNGSGIDAEFIATAFVRHATSKISHADDLENIHTLGFRGEALASVASVARIELLTKAADAEFACLYRISGGQEEGLEAAARPIGTTITVRDLFYNTPARMKFLKKDTSEGNYVSDVVMQLSLSHPEIAFKFTRDGKVQFQTPGDGKLRGAAYAALSREFAHDLVEVDYTEDSFHVSGLVTPPKNGRASRAMQYFFINGRFVNNRTMMAALEAAYKGVMMQGKFPGCVLSLTMPANLVDVNVHPAKTEVRFAREKDVFDMIYKAVKSVLLTPQSTEKVLSFTQRSPAVSQPVDFDAPVKIPQMVAPAAQASPSVVAVPAHHIPEIRPMPQQVKTYTKMIETLAEETVVPYETSKVEPVKNTPVEPQTAAPVEQTMMLESEPQTHRVPLRFVGEVFDTYIVTQRGTDVCFIDKHAAHERIIYEALVQNYGNVPSQMLLCPVTVLLSAEEKNALMQNAALLENGGVETEDFGGNAVVVRAVPADVVPEDVENLVIELASRLVNNPKNTTSEKTEWVLHSIACRAAIKAGDKTHAAQLLRLAEDVLDGKVPPFCPHGRPIVLKVTQKELEKQFGRQG